MMTTGKRAVFVMIGAAVMVLWYRIYQDPLAALFVLLGAVIAWPVALVRKKEFGAGDILAGGTLGLVVIAAGLRIAAMAQTGDTSGPIFVGFIGQGAFLAAGFAVVFVGIDGKPLSEVLEDGSSEEEGSSPHES